MWPFYRAMLNSERLAARFVSKNEIETIIPSEAIPTAGTYIVTLKCGVEAPPDFHRVHLVVGFKQERVPLPRQQQLGEPSI